MGLAAGEDQQGHPLGTFPPLDSQAPDTLLDVPYFGSLNFVPSPNYNSFVQAQSPTMLPSYVVMPPPSFNPHVAQMPMSLNSSQGLAPPPSLRFSTGMPPPHTSPTFTPGIPLGYSQGIAPPPLSLNFSQTLPPQPSPTALTPSELRMSRPVPPPLSIDTQIVPGPQSPTFLTPQSPTFLHLSQSFGAYQPPQSPTSASANLAFSGGTEGPNGSAIPQAVLSNTALMKNIHFARRNDIPIRWVRVLDVTVHGARNLTTKKRDGTNDAKCKLTLEGATKTTKVSKKSVDPSWEESFKFPVHDLCNITFSIYNHNMIMTDDELCTCTLTSAQLIEGGKVSDWFPMQPNGEISLTIGLSPPRPDSFRFVVHKNSYLGEWNYKIHDSNGNKLFTICSEQNGIAYLRDKNGTELLHTKSSLLPWKKIELFEPGQTHTCATLSSKVALGLGSDYQLQITKGNVTVQVKDGMGSVRYMFVDHKNRNISFIQAPPGATSAIIEIAADQEIPLFLICGAVLGCATA